MQGLFFEYSRKIFDERLREMDELVRRFHEVAVVDLKEIEEGLWDDRLIDETRK